MNKKGAAMQKELKPQIEFADEPMSREAVERFAVGTLAAVKRALASSEGIAKIEAGYARYAARHAESGSTPVET